MANFLYGSQVGYEQAIGVMGPVAAAYIWNRWDNYVYGQPDTWTMYHWGNRNPWPGYQPRAFFAAARAWQDMTRQKIGAPLALITFTERWIRFLVRFVKDNDGRTPRNFPPNAPPNAPEGEFEGDMAGLFLAGASHAYRAGCRVDGILELIETIYKQIKDNYVTDTNYPDMVGSWSPWVGGGMFFGFWSGELLRGLGSYILHRKQLSGELSENFNFW